MPAPDDEEDSRVSMTDQRRSEGEGLASPGNVGRCCGYEAGGGAPVTAGGTAWHMSYTGSFSFNLDFALQVDNVVGIVRRGKRS